MPKRRKRVETEGRLSQKAKKHSGRVNNNQNNSGDSNYKSLSNQNSISPSNVSNENDSNRPTPSIHGGEDSHKNNGVINYGNQHNPEDIPNDKLDDKDKSDNDKTNSPHKDNDKEKTIDKRKSDQSSDNKDDNRVKNISDDNNKITPIDDTDQSSKIVENINENTNTDNVLSKTSDKLGDHSETLDTLNKVRKFNDIKNMTKEEATKEVVALGKTFIKQKLISLFFAYVAPWLLPVLGILAIILLILTIILTVVNGDNESSNDDKCDEIKQATKDTNIKSGSPEQNAQKIFDYLLKNVKGSSAKSVASHLGNMHVETGGTFDPAIIQNHSDFKESIAMDSGVNGYAMGIAQWDGGRRVNLLKYAKSKDKKWGDLGIQLEFMLNHDGTDSDTLKKILKEDSSINNTTKRIMMEWERAGATTTLGERQAAASKYYAKFGKGSKTSSNSNIDDATDAASDNSDASENSGCNSGGGSSKTSGKLGASTKANGGSGEIIKQWKSKDAIPDKFKKHIELPDFEEAKYLDRSENIFPVTGNRGQCTELTWGYMSQLWNGTQPTNGNGNVIYRAYKQAGAKTTNDPTVGYGFSSNPPYAGATMSSVGHTGVVVGVMEDGKWIMANYNLNGEGNAREERALTYALVDGNKKSGAITFFSGIGEPKIKSKDK
ncbi:phage tail tip lysozyme [Staphylococcus hyicus]|uniref:phage tail tip lysozyme n=1 Tax=Staphylococcus hyicus TaxID=1284 RepID=UPI0031332097